MWADLETDGKLVQQPVALDDAALLIDPCAPRCTLHESLPSISRDAR
jgi:hypothetical protein